MIKFNNLSIKNFLSIGNVEQNLNLSCEELTLILGENRDTLSDSGLARNGCGKSTILNALSYVLYSFPISKIKKPSLVNISNGKNMVVTIDFEVDNVNYKIVRGRSPNILEFYTAGVKHQDKGPSEDSAQGDSRETQAAIQKVLGMSYEMFTQIVALNTYTTPFLLQSSNEQRVIIEELLGISLLSSKAELLKEEIKKLKENITIEDIRLKSTKASNDRIQTQIDNLLHRQITWRKAKETDIQFLKSKIEKLSKIDIEEELNIHSAWNTYDNLTRDRNNLLGQKKTITSTIAKETKRKETIENEIETLNSQSCHTCKQKIQGDMHSILLQEATSKLNSYTAEINSLNEALSLLDVELSGIVIPDKPMAKNYNTLSEVHDHRNKLMLVNQEFEARIADVDPYQEQIDGMKNSALEEIDMTCINDLSKLCDHQEFLWKLLTNKDSFIRKKIIEQNLSFLNSRLNHYLTELGLPHEVIFQNDLSISISELGRELSPGNLSRGESVRLILSLTFSFREVWEHLYNSIDLFFIDEILDAGLDQGGAENAVKLLQKFSRDMHKSCFLISHREEIRLKCSNILTVIKENGYTKLVKE